MRAHVLCVLHPLIALATFVLLFLLFSLYHLKPYFPPSSVEHISNAHVVCFTGALIQQFPSVFFQTLDWCTAGRYYAHIAAIH